MTSKYIFRAAAFVLSVVVFMSCLGNNDGPDMEHSSDAQIYTFSISSRADTLDLLDRTRFTIDQVEGRLFNQEFLPYRFSVDSIMLNIVGTPHSWVGLSAVEIHLINPDSSFVLTRNDSIYWRRLDRIETTAADRVTTREYTFQLNIFQQDPYIISWLQKSDPYITSSIDAQRTIALNGTFITYYLSSGSMNAVVSSNQGANWTAITPTGLPATTIVSSITSVGNVAFAIDDANVLHRTFDGATWTDVATDVIAIYGLLPAGFGRPPYLLVAVDDGGTPTFALIDDFLETAINIDVRNAFPNNIVDGVPMRDRIPMRDFSSVAIDKSTTVMQGIRYIVLAGGVNYAGLPNNDVWIFEQQTGGAIRAISHETTRPLHGSSLFFYDNRLYALIINAEGDNDLIFSRTYGLLWSDTGEDQVFPTDFLTRRNATVFTDANEYIWIFGGQSLTGEFSDTWRGRLNRLDEGL